jgi:predicted phage baseplate assembly protein
MADSSSSGASDCCGCCEGLTQETPQTIENRPGLPAIAYRVGVYSQFRETLLARISQSRQPLLRALRTREDNDFTIALLDAFSVMADVLTFYSERIANEAYLMTAVERLSVRQLANLVGYRMSPGVAADAYLAFTIDPSAGAFGTALTAPVNAQVLPELQPSIIVPIGTRVQSIPGPGEKPQTFETLEQIDARPEWNAMAPLLNQPQIVATNANSLVVSGAVSNLKIGDRILLLTGPLNTPSTTLRSIVNLTVLPQNIGNALAAAVSSNSKITEVDLDGWNPTQGPGYSPSTFVDGSSGQLTQGDPSTLSGVTDLATAANKLIGFTWDAGQLVTAAKANHWPLDQLAETIDEQVSNQISSPGMMAGEAYVFRQQAAPFGNTAPNYYSLPPQLRIESFDPTSSPPYSDIQPAYPDPWDEPPSAGKISRGLQLSVVITNGSLFLDNAYPQISANSYVAFESADSTVDVVVNQASKNTIMNHSEYTLSSKVSLLGLLSVSSLTQFYTRTTTIHCQSEQLPLAEVPITTPVAGSTITLDGAYLGLLAGRSVILSGQTILTNVGESNQNSPPILGPIVAELCQVTQVSLVGGFTVITFKDPLANTYVRSTVKINANVSIASNGQMVTEILGSGDGTQAFQSFPLHQAPLTYTISDTPSGNLSTLQIYVNAELWTEVPFFYGHGPNEHIYITSQDDAGKTTVIFGDGVTGARLPTGTANISATYRYGIGTGGLVRPNQLSQMMSRPLGVTGVNNPLAATGAQDPETLDDGRGNATLAIMTLGRIVSLEDYQDFARAFSGITKALATWTWNGEQRVVVLTLAGANGAPVSAGDPTGIALALAITKSSEPGVSVTLIPYLPATFRIAGLVTIDPTFESDVVIAAVEAAMRSTFSFVRRNFGQPVHLSEVIAVIQNVDGVVSVELSQFYRTDAFPVTPPLNDLIAQMPQSGARTQPVAAELLTLDPGPLGLKPVVPQ